MATTSQNNRTVAESNASPNRLLIHLLEGGNLFRFLRPFPKVLEIHIGASEWRTDIKLESADSIDHPILP